MNLDDDEDVLDVTLEPETDLNIPAQDSRPWLISDEQLQMIGLPPRRPTDPNVLNIDEDPATLQRRKLAAQTESAEIKAEMDYLRLKQLRAETAQPSSQVAPQSKDAPTLYTETQKHIKHIRSRRRARRQQR